MRASIKHYVATIIANGLEHIFENMSNINPIMNPIFFIYIMSFIYVSFPFAFGSRLFVFQVCRLMLVTDFIVCIIASLPRPLGSSPRACNIRLDRMTSHGTAAPAEKRVAAARAKKAIGRPSTPRSISSSPRPWQRNAS